MLLETLPKLIDVAAKGEVAAFPGMKRPRSPVFESRVGDLGLLGPKLAERVAFVYGLIEAFRSMMEAAVASDVTAEKQHTALKGALESARRARVAAEPLIKELHTFAMREPLEPR